MITADDIYRQLEQRIADWALDQLAIEAVIVVGSRARSVHAADEWSDLDLVIFASDATSYLRDSAWLNTFGTMIAAVSHSFGQHDREWIAFYADGVKLDAAFLSIEPVTTPTLQHMLDAFPYPNVLQRGVRVLVDKTGTLTELHLPKIDAPQPPTQAEFTALINRMWLDAIKTAKFIRRADLWRAKQVCDGDLKQHVLTLLEWQAAAQPDQRDIWYDGRFLAEWADREVLAALPATFAAYEIADLVRALFATLELFRHLALDVARRLDYAYPLEADRAIDDRIGTMLRGMT
jgi:aminoglycoside 6-adenylyltransferase